MSEWPKEPISKIGTCSDVRRGFESHPLRHASRSCKPAGQARKRPTRTTLGEVLEWPIRHAWKACRGASPSWVRIPPSPPPTPVQQTTTRAPLRHPHAQETPPHRTKEPRHPGAKALRHTRARKPRHTRARKPRHTRARKPRHTRARKPRHTRARKPRHTRARKIRHTRACRGYLAAPLPKPRSHLPTPAQDSPTTTQPHPPTRRDLPKPTNPDHANLLRPDRAQPQTRPHDLPPLTKTYQS